MLHHRHVREAFPPRLERLAQGLLLVRLEPAGLVEQLQRTGAVGEHRGQCPGPYRADGGAAGGGGLEREAEDGGAVLRGALLADDDLPARGLGGRLVTRAHQHDGPPGPGDDLLPDGTEEEPDDGSVPARAERQQFRVGRGGDQRLGGDALHHLGEHLEPGMPAGHGPYGAGDALTDPAGLGVAVAARTEGLTRLVLPGVHHAQGTVAPDGLTGRPGEGGEALVRSVDACRDRAGHGHCLPGKSVSYPEQSSLRSGA